jgi:hypothetical protein
MSYVHEYTGISSIANNAAYTAIVNWVNDCKNDYITNADKSSSWYANDIAYVDNVLAQFAVTRDVDALIQRIAEQDTYAREYYACIVNDLYSLYYNGEWA